MPPNDTSGGETASCAVAAWPLPDSPKSAVLPVLVVAVSVPPIGPVCVGANVIGTSIVWPAASVAGSGFEGVPTRTARCSISGEDSVIASVAVSVTVFWLVLPIVVVGNAVAEPVSGGVTGEPKPSTWPSRVPT